MLTDADRDYLERRRKPLRSLDAITWGLPILWIGFLVVGVVRFPALIDPVGIAADMDGGTVDWDVVRALARVAPILFLCLVFVISAAVWIFLRSAHRERRLLDMVERAGRGSVSPP